MLRLDPCTFRWFSYYSLATRSVVWTTKGKEITLLSFSCKCSMDQRESLHAYFLFSVQQRVSKLGDISYYTRNHSVSINEFEKKSVILVLISQPIKNQVVELDENNKHQMWLRIILLMEIKPVLKVPLAFFSHLNDTFAFPFEKCISEGFSFLLHHILTDSTVLPV